MRKILVRTGFKGEDGEYDVRPDFVAENLLDAAQKVLDLQRR
jgi:hypothetical protein